ncbi:MAG TPA: hypothetical protein VHL50_08225 [Pyrinomonadaceae bacterium]|nr:hypothetical protein [Pyrinomonadaceae bacterium]
MSIVLLAVHFLRSEHEVLVVAASLSLFLLLIRRGWSRRLLQVTLLAASAEWLRVLAELVDERRLYNMPYTRLAVIIGSVAALAAAAVLILSTKRIAKYFSSEHSV